jgi:membrane fusion protein, multidrug efflux system
MKRSKAWMLVSLLAGTIIIVLSFAAQSQQGASAAVAPRETPRVPVRVALPELTTIVQTESYAGNVEAWERAHISGPTGQRIERIHVREGERVARGQLLVEMDGTSLRQAEIELRTLQADLERIQRLGDLGAVPRQQREQTEAQFEAAQASVAALRRNTQLRAPIEGVVTGRYFVDGEQFVVNAEAPSIVTLQTVDPLRVVINVSERHFQIVRAGMPARVRFDTYEDRVFAGNVERIIPVVSPDSRTFRVEIRIDNTDGLLSPGMFARVALDLGEVDGWFLPRTALQTQRGTGQSFVYVIEEGIARRVELTLGARVDERQQVLAGLPHNAWVVVDGIGRLHDGTPVRIVD